MDAIGGEAVRGAVEGGEDHNPLRALTEGGREAGRNNDVMIVIPEGLAPMEWRRYKDLCKITKNMNSKSNVTENCGYA
jgi:hypothetical protein